MSERLDHEASSSVLVSALGVWLGLGGGLALLSLALLAVLNAVFHEDLSRDPHNVLKNSLAADLASAPASSLTVSEDGSSLQLMRTRPGSAELFVVVYACQNDKLTRSSDEILEYIGHCPEFKFSIDDQTVSASFRVGESKQGLVWAIDRWGILDLENGG